MITPSFNLTATERVLPKLALDFTTASLDSRVTFTRTGNTATVVNSNGNVVGINADLPRFDFDPITLACKGLLIEEARTNLWVRSSEFNSWTKTRSTVDSDVINSPDGTQNADKLVCDSTASNTHRLELNITAVSGTVYTMSVFAKAAELPAILIREESTATGAFFNLTNGTVGNVVAGSSATITNYGNGWYRCTMTYTQSGTLGRGRIELATAATTNSNVFSGNGVDGVYLWGAQWEAGAFPTSYIPTVASTVLRNADVAVMTGTNFSDWYNATEGTFVVSYGADAKSFQVVTVWGSDALTIETRVNALVVFNTTLQVNATAAGFLAGSPNKIATAYKLNNSGAAINGNVATVDTTCTIPAGLTTFNIGSFKTGVRYIGTTIGEILYFPLRVTNNELQAFSKG